MIPSLLHFYDSKYPYAFCLPKGIRTATIGVLVFEYIYIIVWILDIYIIMDSVEY